MAANEDERAALGVLAEGYLANRESFRFIDCRFQYVHTEAASVRDALDGRFVGKRSIQHGHWLVNGANVRYELMCDPAVIEAARKRLHERDENARKTPGGAAKGAPTWTVFECLDKLCLTSSDGFSMNYSPLPPGANLFPKEIEDHPGISLSPFNIEIMGPNEYSNPARYLRDCLSGRFVGHYLGTERIWDGALLAAAVGTSHNNMRMKFGFDPQRGYLPVYIADHGDKADGSKGYKAFITEAKRCSNARWFPMRTVSIYDPDSKPPLMAQEVKVLKLDVDSEPALDRFYLDLPKGIQVNVPGRPAWCTLTKQERIAPRDLAALYARCVAHGEEYVAKGGKMGVPAYPTTATQGRSWSRITLTASAAVLLAALVWFALKRRSGRAA